MQHLIGAITTSSLERLVRSLERRLIDGTARADDIEAYVSMQCEIAARQLAHGDVAGEQGGEGHDASP